VPTRADAGASAGAFRSASSTGGVIGADAVSSADAAGLAVVSTAALPDSSERIGSMRLPRINHPVPRASTTDAAQLILERRVDATRLDCPART
jgi:hypothetical protein